MTPQGEPPGHSSSDQPNELGLDYQHRAVQFAVIDVETTGLDPQSNRIIECAVVILDHATTIIDEWSTLVDISDEYVVGAEWIHGISRDMLTGSPRFDEVAGSIVQRLKGRVVLGHVLQFDLSHLEMEFQRAQMSPLPSLSGIGICTRDLTRAHLTPGPRSLGACCTALDIDFPRAHTALGDARATAQLFRHFLVGDYIYVPTTRAQLDALRWPNVAANDVAARPRQLGIESALANSSTVNRLPADLPVARS